MMKRRLRDLSVLCGAFWFLTATVLAERPGVYALKDARIVVAPGKVIAKGTVIIRDGLIEAVGAGIPIPPDAVEFDATGKTIYPGLIDACTNLGLRRATTTTPPATGGGRGAGAVAALLAQQQPRETPAGALHPLSRVHPETESRNLIVPFEGETTDAQRYRNIGITTVVSAPDSGVFRGESSLINLKDAQPTRDLILKDQVAQHIAFEMGGRGGGGGGGGYPGSLMGIAAAIRQTLLDTEQYNTWKKRYAAHPAGMKRPEFSSSFEALIPVLDRARMVVFEADTPADVLLADRLAREFNLNAVMTGSGREWELLDQIKATGRTLILPASIPERPRVDDADEATETDTRDLRRFVNAPENPKRLRDAGVKFVLSTRGVRNAADFPANMKKMIDAGLPADAALAALTTTPAELLGVSAILGTVEKGKIANLFVTDGDLFGDRTRVLRVYVDGVEYRNDDTARPRGNPTAPADPRGGAQ